MAKQKKPVHRVEMTEGKRNIIRQLLEEYDIETAEQYFGEEPEFKKMFKITGGFWRELNKEPEIKIRSLAYVKDECKKLIDQIEKE